MERAIKGQDYRTGMTSGDSKYRDPSEKNKKDAPQPVKTNKLGLLKKKKKKRKKEKTTFPKGFYNTVYVVVDAPKI